MEARNKIGHTYCAKQFSEAMEMGVVVETALLRSVGTDIKVMSTCTNVSDPLCDAFHDRQIYAAKYGP